MCGKTKLLGRGVEILIFGTMPVRVSEIPQSDLSELSAMERRDDPWINMWHQHSSQTPTAALQPQYPILGTSTSAPQPHTPPQHPNLIPQPHTPASAPQPHTPTSAPQPQHPNLSTPTSAPQPHTLTSTSVPQLTFFTPLQFSLREITLCICAAYFPLFLFLTL